MRTLGSNSHLAAHGRSKQRKFPDTVVPAEIGQLVLIDLYISEL